MTRCTLKKSEKKTRGCTLPKAVKSGAPTLVGLFGKIFVNTDFRYILGYYFGSEQRQESQLVLNRSSK